MDAPLWLFKFFEIVATADLIHFSLKNVLYFGLFIQSFS